MDAKDQLIQEQAAEVKRLCVIIVQLKDEIARLKKDSSTSSKLPLEKARQSCC